MSDNQVQDTETEPVAPDATQPAPALDAGPDTSDLQAKFEDMRKQKSRANKEAQELKRNYEAMQAKLQEYEDRDKSEVEKALAKAEKAEKAMIEMANKASHLERVTAVISAGVEATYSDYIAGELAKAQDADGEIDVPKWLENFKTKNPAFFGSKTPAPASGQGGPGPANGKGGKAGQLEAINQEIAELQKDPRRNQQQLLNLRIQAGRLQREIGN